jgi:glutamyl-tRNA reductase
MARWVKSLSVTPTIVDLRSRVEAIRRAEVERVLARFAEPGTDEALRQALDTATTAFMNKILHMPMAALRDKAIDSDGALPVEIVRKLFHLDEASDASASSASSKPEGTDPALQGGA